jgi:hypothetical protein
LDRLRLSVGHRDSAEGRGTVSLATASGLMSAYGAAGPAATGGATAIPLLPHLPLESYHLTISEAESSSFQVELPAKSDVVFYARLSLFMTDHTSIHSHYDFDELEGVPLPLLERRYLTFGEHESSERACHRTMVSKLARVGVEDLVIQNFVRSFGGVDQRVEASVASSENRRQIVVCLHVVGEHWTKKLHSSTKETALATLPDAPGATAIQIHAAHHSAYFGASFEEELFSQLEKAVARLPL